MIRNPVAETLTSSIQSQPVPAEPRKSQPPPEIRTDNTATASREAEAAKNRENRAAAEFSSANKNLDQATTREEAAQTEARQAAQKESAARKKMETARNEASRAQAEADQAARENDLKVSGRAVNIFA